MTRSPFSAASGCKITGVAHVAPIDLRCRLRRPSYRTCLTYRLPRSNTPPGASYKASSFPERPIAHYFRTHKDEITCSGARGYSARIRPHTQRRFYRPLPLAITYAAPLLVPSPRPHVQFIVILTTGSLHHRRNSKIGALEAL
jgi:hypothetical protein